MQTLVICSGGLDSVTLAHRIAAADSLAGILTFNYGQRHLKEVDFARACAQRLSVPFDLIDITGIGAHLVGSSLTDSVDVPDGHYAEETMRATVVPNRNAIMLTIAFGLANARKLDAVATAVHGGDHFIYPDCRPGFVQSFQTMQDHALEGFGRVRLLTPYIRHGKEFIAEEGKNLGVPFDQTWSCYKGKDQHCGRCGTCVERREAFDLAGVDDPTIYEDQTYWREAIAKREMA